MSRILMLADAGAHTGFARVTHNIGEQLVTRYGHSVAVLGANYRGDYMDTPLRLYLPTLRVPNDVFGMSRILEVLNIEQPDVVVMLNDPQVVLKYLFDNTWDETRIFMRHRPILAYMPIDGTNQPKTWDVLEHVVKRVAMTKFGQRYMPEAPVIYHGVDTERYRPISEGPLTLSTGVMVKTKKEAKRAFGYDPDGFLVLRVDRNSMRKDYPSTIKALWPFLARHNDVQVHLHCQPIDPMGTNLSQMLNREQGLKDRFYFPDSHNTFEGWAEADLAALYNAADVFISTSWGEGFGLTLAEAAACGLPILAQNVACIPEVAGPGGRFYEPLTTVTVPSGEDQWLPNVEAFTEGLERIYQASSGVRRKLGQAGREHVKRSFSWDVATAQMHGLITDLVKARDPQEETR